jgi:dGTPase
MLFKRIYRHPDIMRIRAGAAQIVTDLFGAYMANPKEMQSHYWVDHIAGLADAPKARHVGDYLAGMTDTYAISAHNRLFDRTPDLR